MVLVGKSGIIGGGGQPGHSLILQGCDTGSPYVWIKVVGTFRNNEKCIRDHPCGFPMTDHREAGYMVIIWVMGEIGGQGGATSSGDAVVGHVQAVYRRQ